MRPLFQWLVWRIAGREMRELERWRVEYEILRRWLAEFPDVAVALDHMRGGAVGAGGRMFISDLRDSMRRQRDGVHDELRRRLRAISVSVTGRGDSTESDVMSAIDALHDASLQADLRDLMLIQTKIVAADIASINLKITSIVSLQEAAAATAALPAKESR